MTSHLTLKQELAPGSPVHTALLTRSERDVATLSADTISVLHRANCSRSLKLRSEAARVWFAGCGPPPAGLPDARILIHYGPHRVPMLTTQAPPGTHPPTESRFLCRRPVRLDGSSIGSLGPRSLSGVELPVPIHTPSSDEVVRVARQSRGRDRRSQRHLSVEDDSVSRRGQFGDDLATTAARTDVSSGRVRGRDIEKTRLHRCWERLNEVCGVVVGRAHSTFPLRSSLRNSL